MKLLYRVFRFLKRLYYILFKTSHHKSPFIEIQVKSFQFQPNGVNIAGVVSQTDMQDQKFKIGDSIYGFYPDKTRFINKPNLIVEISKAHFALKADNISFTQAASITQSGAQVVEMVCEILKVKPHHHILLLANDDIFSLMSIELIQNIGATLTVIAHENSFSKLKRYEVDLLLNTEYNLQDILSQEYDALIDTTEGEYAQGYLEKINAKGKLIMRYNRKSITPEDPSVQAHTLANHPTKERLQILSFLIEEQIIHLPYMQGERLKDSDLRNLKSFPIASDDTIYEKD